MLCNQGRTGILKLTTYIKHSKIDKRTTNFPCAKSTTSLEVSKEPTDLEGFKNVLLQH